MTPQHYHWHDRKNALIKGTVLACMICFLSAPSAAQLYLKNNNTDNNAAQKKSLFLKNKPKSGSQVYTPPPVAVQPQQQGTTYNNSLSYQQQNNSSNNYRAVAPQIKNGAANQIIKIPHKCSDREYQIYKKMNNNMQRFTDIGQRSSQQGSDRDGNVTFTYSKDDQAFIDSFQTSFDQMLLNPQQNAKYNHIMSECSYRESLSRR